MGKVILQFTYHRDIINVPDYMSRRMRKYQILFDEWLYDKNNDHEYWYIVDGQKLAVEFGTDAFVKYLNQYHLKNSDEKAIVLERELEITNSRYGYPILYFWDTSYILKIEFLSVLDWELSSAEFLLTKIVIYDIMN